MTEVPFSLQHIKDRCIEVGDCWEWVRTYHCKRWPVIAARRDWDGEGVYAKQFYIRHLSFWHAKGAAPRLGTTMTVVPSCGNWRCVCPDHMKRVRRADTPKPKPPSFGARVAATRRKTSKLSDAAVEEIRSADRASPELAQRHGISLTYVYMIRNGEFRRDYLKPNPFAGLMACNDNNRRAA